MKEKGIDELFTAMRRLHAEYGDKVVLDIVGFFEDEYKDVIEKMVEDGIAVFHGFQEETRPYYVMADCVVLPSYHEGMSNVLLRLRQWVDRLLQVIFLDAERLLKTERAVICVK